MAIVFTGSKTVTTDVSPSLTAAALTTLLAIAPENMTTAQLSRLVEACSHVYGGSDPAKTIGSLLV